MFGIKGFSLLTVRLQVSCGKQDERKKPWVPARAGEYKVQDIR